MGESSLRDWKTILAYPMVQLSVMAFVITGLMVFIVPNFMKIFDDLLQGEPLPELTQLVISASAFVKDNFSEITFIIIIISVLIPVLSRSGLLIDFFFLLPFVGRKIRLFMLYDVAKSMSCFMAAGDDVIQAAESTMHCQKSFQIRVRLKKFIADVRAGSSWIEAWERHMNLGSSIHLWMMRQCRFKGKSRGRFCPFTELAGRRTALLLK